MRVVALVLALIAAPLAAQEGRQPVLAEGEELEAEARADFNSDGLEDLAYVARNGPTDVAIGGNERRELRVVISYRNETDFGHNPAQVLALDPYPLAPATLTLKGNVLLLNDLTGGTTAVFSTHRFRWDPKLDAMRLIGLDATFYSRTFAHDGKEASWNLLTGVLLTHTLRLRQDDSDRAYDEVGKQRRRKASPPLRLEQSPSGDDLLGWPGAK